MVYKYSHDICLWPHWKRPLVAVNDMFRKMPRIMTFYDPIGVNGEMAFFPLQYAGMARRGGASRKRSNGKISSVINNSYRKLLLLINSRQIEITKTQAAGLLRARETCAVHKMAILFTSFMK